MSEFKFESFEDFEGFLTTLPVEKLKNSFPVLVALFEKQRKTFDEQIPKDGDPLSLLSLPPEKLKELFSLFEQQMPLLLKESEAMVRCARILFDKEIAEGRMDGDEMIKSVEKMHEAYLKVLDSHHQSLRFSADPKTVIAEYEELAKQNPRPTPSNSGCMVVFLVLFISIVAFLL